MRSYGRHRLRHNGTDAVSHWGRSIFSLCCAKDTMAAGPSYACRHTDTCPHTGQMPGGAAQIAKNAGFPGPTADIREVAFPTTEDRLAAVSVGI